MRRLTFFLCFYFFFRTFFIVQPKSFFQLFLECLVVVGAVEEVDCDLAETVEVQIAGV